MQRPWGRMSHWRAHLSLPEKLVTSSFETEGRMWRGREVSDLLQQILEEPKKVVRRCPVPPVPWAKSAFPAVSL